MRALACWPHEHGFGWLGTDGLSIGPAENGAATQLAALARGMVFVEALAMLPDAASEDPRPAGS